MDGRRGARRWAMVLLPALALTACGGSRLSHDEIVSAYDGTRVVASAPSSGQTTMSGGGGAAAAGSIGGAPGTSGIGAAGGAAGIPAPGGTVPRGATGTAGGGPSASFGSAPAPAHGPQGAAAVGAPLLLGNVGTYSGPVGSSLAGGATGVQVWAAWVNAHGGIAGHPVKMFTADDGGDPARNRAEVQDMVESKHVVAFVANEIPLTAEASVSYLEQKHIPVVGGDAATNPWTSSPMMFPGGTTFGPMLEATLKMAHELNDTKYAVLYCVEAAPCNLMYQHLNDAAPKYGEQIVYNSRISLTQPDFTAQCLGAQQAGAQVVYLGADASSQERIANSCARQGYHPLWVTSAQALTNHMAQTAALDGIMAASTVFPWMLSGGSPGIEAYSEAMRQYAPDLEPSGATAIAWASGELLRKAAAGIGAQPTSDAILAGLWGLRNETLDGLVPPQSYAAHQPSAQIPCYFVVKATGGKWTAPIGGKYQCL